MQPQDVSCSCGTLLDLLSNVLFGSVSSILKPGEDGSLECECEPTLV